MNRHIPFSLSKSGMLSACVGAVVMAQAFPTLAQDSTLEEIVVTGIRSSVTKALDMKRTEVGVSDAISADDIASLPDENIAESIQRIPGIQIQRSNGRGALISIRGLGPEYAATTVNGQAFASAQFDEGFRYDIVQSELASNIQVFKTPSASVDEGGLSGTVNIGTAKPLGFNETKRLLKVTGIRSGDRNSTTPGGSFTYIDQLNDRLGVLFNVGYQELDTRYDLMYSQRFTDIDADGDGESDFTASGIPVERTNRPRLRREDGNTERLLFNGAVQYFVNDDLELNFTAILADDDRKINFQQLVPLFGGGDPAPSITLLGQTGATVDQVLAENIRVEANHTLQTEDRASKAFTGQADWVISDNLKTKGVLHYTAGSMDKVERAIVLGIRSDLRVDMDTSNPAFISNGLNPVSDPDSWAVDNLFRNDIAGKVETFETDELAIQFDLEYTFDTGMLRSLKAGIKHRAQTLDTESTRFDRNYHDEDVVNAPFPTVADANVVVKDFTGGEFPGLSLNYVLPDVDAYLASFDASGHTIEGNFSEDSFFEIDRDIFTVYGQLDFEVGDLRGNAGLRYARTNRDIDTVNFDGGIQVTTGAFTDIGGDSGVPTSTSFDYDNWLPSLNLAYDLTEDVILRAAAGRVLVRPIIGDTATFGRSIAATDDGTDTIITVEEGSFDLPALTADQFDLSAEWYFSESSAVSLAYFRKDVENQIASETVCPSDFALADVSADSATGECVGDDGNIYNIIRNRTTDGVLKINGVELAYNQSFDFLPAPFDGLGLIANYTVLDADNPDEKQPLLGSSEDTYNFIAYYENGGFSGRVALNHRSEYSIENSFSGDSYAPSSEIVPDPGSRLDARNQIDVSLAYAFDEGLKLSLEGINVNGDYERGTRFESSRLQSVATFGSTWFLNAQYNF
ncbi:TonB-dependent receptor [Microbulbifer sp.]|uniref:TonB-dependent receptor n=1 Tax=Microbulbifer sp. TaxID=1908541 RepID=UPI003F2DD0DD